MRGEIVLLLVAIVMVLLGITFGIASAAIWWSGEKLKTRCTAETKGVVTDMLREQLSGAIGEAPMYSWYPVFQYEADGHNISKRALYGDSKERFYIGQEVTIRYNPNNPNEFWIKGIKHNGISRIFLIVSAGLLLAGICSAISVVMVKNP